MRKLAAMPKSDTSRRWFGFWRSANSRSQDDPADHGTAFGLDLSLSRLAEDLQAEPAPMQREQSWMQRVLARRRPAF
jgi:type II secretory pathway component PulK